ncbi:MAG TPA: ABC transporter ATP-binding protein [Nitrosospira sp.]|nr:ABC transporter ATP-binding protein [Nitrosospira sp.]
MVLQTTDLTLQYPGKVLCRNLNLTVNPGECWAILGQNGCGKTTLIHALGGLVQPKDGPRGSCVTFAGKAPKAWRRLELARKLGILLQDEPGEFWGSVYEYVLLGRHPHVHNTFGWGDADQEIVMQALDRMGLKGLARRPLVTLSGGERQRARIALLLAQSPQYYLLDEPLLHLDLRHQLNVTMLFKELAEQGKSVVMVLHDVDWANRFCDHALMLFEDGHTIVGPVEKVLNLGNLEALYQCDVAKFSSGFNTGCISRTMRSV